MENIIDYIEKYGNKTFKELEFNKIDNVILVVLSYINFEGIVESKKVKISLGEAGKIFFSKYSKKEIKNNILGIKTAIKIFENIYEKERYKNLNLYNYCYKGDEHIQFSAIFIDLDENNTYISFEGTDELISGWKEDAQMAYLFPVPAQKDAIKYLNKNISIFSKRSYIVGGHSKGGNLALVSSMYANIFVRNKIKQIIMNDGPGLKKAQLESRKYKKIENKLLKIIPNYSIVGMLLRHTDDFFIVSSKKGGILAHNVINWQINDLEFVEAPLSEFSQKLYNTLRNWLNMYNDEERKEFIDDLFSVLSRAGISSLLEIKATSLPKIFAILKESTKIRKKSRDMIITLVKFSIKYLREDLDNKQ